LHPGVQAGYIGAGPSDEFDILMRTPYGDAAGSGWLRLTLTPLLCVLLATPPVFAADSAREPTSTGVVIANRTVILAAKIIGRVAAVNSEEADKVDQGDVLVDIGDAELRADLAAAEARLKREEINLSHMDKLSTRVKKLHAQNAASAENLDDASFRYSAALEQVATARATLARSRAMLDETKIRAPFAGIIIAKRVEVGDVTSPGEPLLKLEDHSILKFKTSVSEKDVPLIEPGQKVVVTIDALGNLELAATVSKIIPSGDEATHEFIVEAVLPATKKLYPGMFGKARFIQQH
jgi:RND family efflux transporter MFP subunit